MSKQNDSAHQADLTAWLAVAAGTIGAFMATLDSSIVNASLPTIQGEIGANATEGTWISTAYLVAEIIMISLAGFLDRLLGLRTFLLLCASLFTFFSAWCGFSDSLPMMIFGRIGQGFSGGAMIPTALTIVATRLPPAKRSIGVALFGATAVLGPVLGPLVGGWLTENISWHYAFFINVPIGIGLVILIIVGLPHEKSDLGKLAEADWLGILGLIAGLGGLTTVLEEGQRERWFESNFICTLSAISALGFLLVLLGQFVAARPVIRLYILFQRSFASVFLLSLVVGAALYGISYMLPQFLTTFADYNAQQSGEVTLISGVPSIVMMPFFPYLIKQIDVRLAIGMGMLLYTVGCFLNIHLLPISAGGDFFISQTFTGFGQFFTLLFLNQVATTSVSAELAEDASGLFNAARNLGGSIGLALIGTYRERWTTLHTTGVAEAVTANAVYTQDYVRQTRLAMGDPVAGLASAYSSLSTTIQSAAESLAFNDLFWTFSIVLFFSIPLVFLLKPLPKDVELSAG